jgi:hypothetical protein
LDFFSRLKKLLICRPCCSTKRGLAQILLERLVFLGPRRVIFKGLIFNFIFIRVRFRYFRGFIEKFDRIIELNCGGIERLSFFVIDFVFPLKLWIFIYAEWSPQSPYNS